MPATRASTCSGTPRPKPTKKTPAPAKVKSTTKPSKASREKPDPVSDEQEDDGPINDTLPEDTQKPTEDEPRHSVPLAEDVRLEDTTTPTEDVPHRSVPPTEDTPHRSASPTKDVPYCSMSPAVPRRPPKTCLAVPRRPSKTSPVALPQTSPSRETTPDLKEFELEFGLRSKTTPELRDVPSIANDVASKGRHTTSIPKGRHAASIPKRRHAASNSPKSRHAASTAAAGGYSAPSTSASASASSASASNSTSASASPPPPPPPLPKQAPSQIVSNLHAPATKEGDSTLQGGSWAARNPGALQQPVRQHKRVEKPVEDKKEEKRVGKGKKEKGEAEKNTMKEKRKVQAEVKDEYLSTVSDFLAVIEKTAEELADRFDKMLSEVKKALRGVTRAQRRPRAREKYSMKDDCYTNMTPEEQEVLLKVFAEAKGVKYSGTQLSNAAACRDVTAFTKHILAEWMGTIGFLVLGRSSMTDTLNTVCVGPPEALKFLPEVMHTTPDIFSVKFDHCFINREAVGLELLFAQLRKETVGLIAEGLERKLSKKVPMMYGDYDKLLSNHGVELLGWPAEVNFMNLSALGSMDRLRPLHEALIQGKYCWETMSDARKAEHSAAVKAKVAKEKKPRFGKGMSKAEAKAAKEREMSKFPEEGRKR
ncbi:hypothetical protein DFH09DRAFT_1481173 [Mycena vulgaris]|nr:hypothetical protein DFH09DRAFT_1481173 [Mycena vulgaris]